MYHAVLVVRVVGFGHMLMSVWYLSTGEHLGAPHRVPQPTAIVRFGGVLAIGRGLGSFLPWHVRHVRHVAIDIIRIIHHLASTGAGIAFSAILGRSTPVNQPEPASQPA